MSPRIQGTQSLTWLQHGACNTDTESAKESKRNRQGLEDAKPGFRAKDFGLYEAGIAKSLTHYKQKSNMDRSALLKMYPDFRTE